MKETFRSLIAANKRNSFFLVIGFCLFFVTVATILGGALYTRETGAQSISLEQSVMIGLIAGGIAFLISLFAYFGGDSLVLGVSGAQEISHADDPELFNVVEEIAIAAGIPTPRIYLIAEEAPNAFATGRDPAHAVVAITIGLRTKLTRDELQGVIAHEISHIRNYDIRLHLLLAVLVGSLVMLADFFRQSLWFSRGRRSSDSDRDSKGGGIGTLILFVLALVLSILAPFLAQLIQLAVSRQREFLADASAVELTRYPRGLASALRKIAKDPMELHSANRGTAHLYIVNPIEKFAARAESMLSSHPPIEERIKRLEALA